MSDRQLTLTFLTPHQRRPSGGVYVIEQFAQHLAGRARVRLVVAKGPTRPLPGVEIFGSEALEHTQMPDADILIVPADFRPTEQLLGLSARSGRRVALFQGYGTPGNPQIPQVLRICEHAVVVSEWLIDEACALGVPATLVRPGLDRAIFNAEHRAARQVPEVGMLTSATDWKGTADGLAALKRVMGQRQAIPRLYGKGGLELEGARNSGILEVREVGYFMRSCDVFVCSSWQEGLGLPGLEALACGAALATSDTHGCRDYAIDGYSALVSAPRDPASLAASIIRLLDDYELRERLTANGRSLIDRKFSDWPEAARRLHLALQTISNTRC